MEYAKLTTSRQSILDCLKMSDKHMSAEEIHSALRNTSSSMGIATVYRNLNYLYEHGFLKRIQDKESGYIYDINTQHHYHFKCEVCGKLFDVELDYQNILNEKVAQELGIQSVSHDITFEGICKDCAKKNTTH